MIVSEYNCIYFEDMVSKYTTMLGKPVIYIRSYGWNNSENVDKINESMDLYRSTLPPDLFTAMYQCEFSFMEIDDAEEAIQFCEDSFPESMEKCELEYYLHYSVYNAQGQIVASN